MLIVLIYDLTNKHMFFLYFFYSNLVESHASVILKFIHLFKNFTYYPAHKILGEPLQGGEGIIEVVKTPPGLRILHLNQDDAYHPYNTMLSLKTNKFIVCFYLKLKFHPVKFYSASSYEFEKR